MQKNKQKWISDKIKKLKKEGKSQEEAVAISYSAYNRMLKGGTYKENIPKYQEAGYTEDYNAWQNNLPFSMNPNLMWNANLGEYGIPPSYGTINQSGKNTPFGSTIQQEMQNVANSQVDPYLQNNMQRPPVQSVVPQGYNLNRGNLNNAQSFMNQGFIDSQNKSIENEGQLLQEDVQNRLSPKNNTSPLNNNNEQIINPFGSIGLDQSLAYAGQGFGSGNLLQGFAGTALSGLKGARTFMSSFASAKENERQKREYERKMREEPQYYQEGGKYREKELAITADSTGVPFTREGAATFNPKAEELQRLQMDLGRYSDVGYYDVTQSGENYIVRPTNKNFKNAAQYKEDLLYLQKLNPNLNIDGIEDGRYYVPPTQRMLQGGATNADLLTGQYLVEGQEQPNVELEDGEYTENSETGEIQEVVGEKHSKGGVKTNLPDQSRVISDYTKIGKDNAKKFKEQFNVKVRATDTFATVLDKVNKDIGLDKLIEEEKEVFKKIEEQETDDSIKDNVKKLNLTALQKKLQSIEEQKEAVKTTQKEAFDSIFKEQEKIPKKKGKNVMKEGGVHEDLDYLSKKYKISKDKLITLMKEGGETIDPKKVTKEKAEEMVKKGIWEDLGDGRYRKKGTEAIEFTTVELEEIPSTTTTMTPQRLQSYKTVWESGKVDKNKYKTLEEFTTAAEKWWEENPDKREKITTTTENSLELIETPEKIEGVPDEFFYVEQEEQKKNAQNTTSDNTQNTTEGSKGLPNIPTIPQDFILPPSARQPVYKQSIQLGRMDSKKGSAEEHLVELERQRQAYNESIKHLSPIQKAALEAYGLMQTQKSSNQAISEKQKEDAQGQYNVDVYNLQAQAKEDLLNSRFEQDYETKTMAAIGNQEKDLRNYFNDLNDQQRFNFEYIDRRNLLNQAYPNYNVSGSSNVGFAGGAPFQDISKFLNPQTVNGKPFSELTDEERDAYRIEQMKNMGVIS